MANRDQWIGWSFLILPWVQVKGLASTILARAARQLPTDWRHHYGYEPVLLETLVDSSDSAEPAIAPPTGSVLVNRRVAAEWIAITRRNNSQSSSSSFRCVATGVGYYVLSD